jgi:hypothetical protein
MQGFVCVSCNFWIQDVNKYNYMTKLKKFHACTVRGPFKKFLDWRQCAAVMQREAVTVMPSCSGGGNGVVA